MARGETGVVIRVLGPLEVVVDGRPVPLGSPQLRRLLVALVVERGDVVSVDRLVEVLWGDAPPVRASGALQTLVYRLRAVLTTEDTEAGRDVVVTRPPGYVLEVSADTVDAARFEATVSGAQSVLRAGDAPGALKLFEEALALWRGPALAEFGFEDFARSEAARLDELRVTATEDRVEARLTLGYHAELVGELEALVDAYPFREGLWAQLMLALYRAGRQREALRAFGRLKALLGEELGLEPSTALRDLEQAIILQEPELDWTAPTNTATAPATADTPGTSAPVPGNLPLQVSSFIGRERDIARTTDALAVARLVTLTGTGGVGKTRLACQVAAEVSPGYRDGAWLCELAPVADRRGMVERVAATLNVQPRAGQSLEDSLLDFLRAKELLVIFDNCEHLVDPIAQLVDRIVHVAPRVSVLATSRESLGVIGERMLAVPSLAVDSEAMTLFVERARDARADFTLSDDNRSAIAQICTRLDGIPLAIELAAARIQAMTPAEIASRLDDQFRLLSSGPRTAVERHQTLRHAMDWSYELLTTDERRVLHRLSVFAAGCTLDAAEAVAAGEGIDHLDVLDHLAALVRRSLLVADDLGDQTRYRFLEPIRQYAHERLEKADDAHVVGRRHAEYYTRLAIDAGSHLRGAGQLAWIARLDPEIANLRAALLWALGQRDFDLALPLVVSVCVNDIAIGYHALAWAERVAAEPEIDEHPLGPVLLAHAAWSAVMTGRIDDAARYETRRVAAEAALGLAPNPATFLAPATIALFSGDAAAAADTARTWIDVARQSGDLYQTGQGLTMLGASLQSRGDPEEAHEVLQESVAHGRRLGNPSNLSWALAWLGVNLLFLHRHEEAVRAMEETIAVGTKVGNRQAVAFARADLGFARAAAGDLRGALAAYVEAATEQVELSVANPVRVTFVRAADALAALGEQEASVVLYGAGTALQRRYRMGDEERELHDRLVETALHVLGQARFAELYDRGASMTPDDALDFARETIARLLNDS